MSLSKPIVGRGFWGPPIWTTLHTLAAAYTPDQAPTFKQYVASLPILLPCEVCRAHLVINLKKYPLENYLTDRNTLFFWTYLLHDAVNQQITLERPNEAAKRSPDYETIKNYYFKNVGDECKACTANAAKRGQ